MNEDIIQLLSSVEPFDRLKSADLKELIKSVSLARYSRGHLLSVQDKTTFDRVFIVKEGSLELSFKAKNKKTLSRTLGTGGIIGGVSILMNAGLSERTVKVKEDSALFVIPKDVFFDICGQHRAFPEHFVNEYTERMVDESYASIIAASQARHFLKDIPPFSFLNEEKLEHIAASLALVYYPGNTVIFVQGETRVDSLYILQNGAAERYFEENNQKNLRGLMGEGDVFGGISMLLNDMIADRTLQTTEDSYFYRLPQGHFFKICNDYEAFSEYFTDSFGKRMLDRSYAAIIAKSTTPRADALQIFNQPVSRIYSSNLVFCDEKSSIQDAAALMSRHRFSSIFVRKGDDEFVGLVTDTDLRNKVIATGIDIQRPISEVMSSPLQTIPEDALVFEAMMTMMQNNIKHLAVRDAGNRVVGVVTGQDMLVHQGQSPFFMMREVSSAGSLDNIILKQNGLPKLVQNLINSGAKAQNVNRFITTVSDTILEKLIGFALQELGPPPVKFVFMILGSEGRKEQTLKTDQDNAIIFEDIPAANRKEVQRYFLTFGERVCGWLDQAGYAFCKGGVMAKNPMWCQPLSAWKQYFRSWIHAAEAQDLLQASIFFDFRCVFGSRKMLDKLRKFLFDSLTGWTGFFRHLTENALHYKPPIGFFRNIVVESRGEHRDAFDIKLAMMPVVDFARILALYHRLEETNTLERLSQLNSNKLISDEDFNEIEQAYSFLMQLRFVRQVTAIIDENVAPDNYIKPKKLSGLEQKMLKEIFKRTENLQTKLSLEFTGSPPSNIA